MYTASYGPGAPDPEFLRRMTPPENEIPVALPLSALLFRGENLALALLGLRVYSTGFAFDLALRARPAAGLAEGAVSEALWGRRGDGAGLLLGLEFADGRRVTSTRAAFPGPPSDDGLIFHQAGGSGGELSADQAWWLSPLPPDGPLRVVARCDALGIAETSTELDGAAIRRAAEQVVELWPWERAPEPSPPPGPDVPGDSWFAEH